VRLSYSASSGATALMAEVWDGTSWSVQPAATPKDALSSFPADVSAR
jgi:hypothetical protein